MNSKLKTKQNEYWQEWFEMCSLERVSQSAKSCLTTQIKKSLQCYAAKLLNGNALSERQLERAPTFFDAWYSERKDAEHIKARKQWLLEGIASGRYNFEQTVYGHLLGKSLFDVMKKLLEDEPLASHPTDVPERITLDVSGKQIDILWGINQFCKRFSEKVKNPYEAIQLLKGRMNHSMDYEKMGMARSTYNYKQNEVLRLIHDIIAEDEELSDLMFVYGGAILSQSIERLEQ